MGGVSGLGTVPRCHHQAVMPPRCTAAVGGFGLRVGNWSLFIYNKIYLFIYVKRRYLSKLAAQLEITLLNPGPTLAVALPVAGAQ